MLAKRQGFPRKLGGCAGLDPRLRSAVSAGVGDGERGLRRGLRAPGVGVRRMWALEYSPSNKTIRYLFSITWLQAGLRTTHRFCGGDEQKVGRGAEHFLRYKRKCNLAKEQVRTEQVHPQGSPQNRPTKVTSKPANEGGPGPGCFTATCRDRASLFWYANSVGHT